MKYRVTSWAVVGFAVACCWILYSIVAPPEFLQWSLRQPGVRAGFVTCPILLLGRQFALQAWWIPLINGATYASAGFVFELLRRRVRPSFQGA